MGAGGIIGNSLSQSVSQRRKPPANLKSLMPYFTKLCFALFRPRLRYALKEINCPEVKSVMAYGSQLPVLLCLTLDYHFGMRIGIRDN